MTTTLIDMTTLNQHGKWHTAAASAVLDRHMRTLTGGTRRVPVATLAHHIAMHQQHAADGDYDAARGHTFAALAECAALLRHDGRTAQVRTVLVEVHAYLAQSAGFYRLAG